MRLVAYTRLSQANDNEAESHEGQHARCVAWAEREGHEVVAHHHDTTSGENGLADRVGLGAALALLDAGDADGLVFAQLDRLSRDVIVQEQILREVWSRHEAFSATASEADLRDDPDDPTRRLIRVVLGAVAEHERAMIALRMARGRRRAAAAGRIIGPAPGFGWRKDPDDPGQAVPVAGEIEHVHEAVKLRASGATLRQVAAHLETATGRRWSPTQAKRVLERHQRYAIHA